MFRYRLRTLLIVLALGPPVLAGVWWYRELLGPVLVMIAAVITGASPIALGWICSL